MEEKFKIINHERNDQDDRKKDSEQQVRVEKILGNIKKVETLKTHWSKSLNNVDSCKCNGYGTVVIYRAMTIAVDWSR